MKREFKNFNEKITDETLKEALKTDSFKSYGLYDPEALKGLGLLSEGLCVMGKMIDKIEELEKKVEVLEYKLSQERA